VDRLMQRMYNSQPPPLPAQYLASCSVEIWVSVHEKELNSCLTKRQHEPSLASVSSAGASSLSIAGTDLSAAAATMPSGSPSSATADFSSASILPPPSPSAPSVLVSCLHISHEAGIEHWLLLLIHTGSREALLLDPLPSDSAWQLANQAKATLLPQLSIHKEVAIRALADYSWRCCYLGVQQDDFSCGVWIPVIWREWLKLHGKNAHKNLEALKPPFCADICLSEERRICSDILYPCSQSTQ
jgi:hypothetical protein